MFLISALIAIAQSQNCVTNQTLGTYIYPTQGSQFALPLNNYFSGPGLQFTTTNPGFQINNYVTGSVKQTNLFGTNTLVATAPLNLNYDPNVQTGIYAYLTQSIAGYTIYQGLQTSAGIQVTQVGVGILTPTYLKCYQLQYIANDSLVVSCLNSTNYQIFYYYNVTLGSLAAPIPISTTNSITLTGTYFSSFQVIQNSQSLIQGVVLYSSPALNQSFVFTYSFTLNAASQISPLAIQQLTKATYQALYGYYINTDGSFFYLTLTTLYYNSTKTSLVYNAVAQQFISLGVYPLLIQQSSTFYYAYYLALATQAGIVNIYLNPLATKNQFTNGNTIAYPTGSTYSNNQLYQLFVNPQYVVYSTGNQIVVSPGYNTNQKFYLWTSGAILSYQITFDVRSSSFTLLSATYTYYQIAQPILSATFSLTSQTGTFIVTATPNSGTATPGTVCTVTFNYQSIAASTPQPLSTLSNSNNYTLPTSQTITYPDISSQVLSPYFYGSNMTYNATSNQPAIFQTKQVAVQSYYNPSRITIQYSAVLSSPQNNNQYIIASQVSSIQQLNLQFCNAQGCLQDSTQQININVQTQAVVVATALTLPFATINSQNTVLAITTSVYNNQILFFSFVWGQPKSLTQYTSSITLPNTFQWTIVNFIIQSNLIYVLTSSPQAVLVYSVTNLATPLYIINEESFTPRQLYQNQQIYPGYVFIDNTYELLIIQTVANTWTTVQNIQYPAQSGASTIGVGLVQDGIFIAQSDGNLNQFIQFYPKISTNPFQLVNVAPQSVNVQVPNLATINTPVQSTFTNNKFYLSWTFNKTQQVGIFQSAPGINNMLYYSQYVAGAAINILSAVSLNTSQPFDVVDALTSAETIMTVQNQTYVQFTPQLVNQSQQQYNITYTVTMPTTLSTQVIQNVSVIDSNTYVAINPTAPTTSSANNVVFFKINPTTYFKGITKNYTAAIVNNKNESENLYYLPVTQPISKSNVNGNFLPQAYTTGTLHGLGGYTLGFAQNNSETFSYYYDPSQKLQNYSLLYKFNSANNYTCCPIIFTDAFSHQLISICNINTTGAYYQNFNYSTKTQTSGHVNINQTNGTGPNIIINFPNVISGLYFNGLLILQFQSYFSFFTVISNSNSVNFTLVQNYTIDASTVSSWSLFGVNSTQSLTYSGIIIVLSDLETVRIVYQAGLTSANVNTPMLTQLINFNPVIDGQIVSIQQAIQTSQLEELVLVIQTNTVGYIYSGSFTYINTLTIVVQQQNKLQQFGALSAVQMLAQNGYIVSVFQSSTQTIVGVYYDINVVQGTTLSFVGFYDATTTGQQPGNFTLTPNGTLFYTYNGGFSQLYVIPELYLSINYTAVPSAAFNNINSTSDYNQISFIVNLTATNQLTSASQLLTIENNIYVGPQAKSTWTGSKNDWFGAFVGIFGAIVLGVIGFLCYKSRPQTFVERDI